MGPKRILTILLAGLYIIAGANPFPQKTQQVRALAYDPGFTLPKASQKNVKTAYFAGPLRVDPANPRYLTDGNGKAIFLAGSNYWNLFQDGGRTNPPPAFDFNAFINFAVAHGFNYMKPHVWEQAWHQSSGDDWYTQPTIYKRTGPGNALDGGPKFDVRQFNDAYFSRLRARVIQAGQAGIYVGIPIFDRFSVRDGNTMSDQWLGHPFHASNNINGIDGDPTHQGNGLDTETLINPAVTAYQEAYTRHVIDVLNDLDNVIWEVAQEPDGTYSRNGYDAEGWVSHFIDYIHTYEGTKPKQHPILFSVFYPAGNNDILFASNAEMVAPNGDGGFDHDSPVLNGKKVVLVDTDHISWTETNGRDWAWKSFTQGAGGFAIMDGGYSNYDDQGGGATYNAAENFRYNLGWILDYASRINLAAMTPKPNLCSSNYCLANAVGKGAEYLAYLPNGGSININLSATSETLNVEWFNPATGASTHAGTINGGGTRTLNTPFSGDSVLYLASNSLGTFTDVPFTHPYFADIETLYANGLTGGCSTNPLKFCPDQIMDRAQAAVFMMRGTYGSGYVPNPSAILFQDNWSKGTWARPWAESMRETGLTSGCQTSPLLYCPWVQLPREQVVIFALKMKYGNSYLPPAATGTVFADLTDPNYYATSWAEKAYADGLILSCGSSGGKPKFCPSVLVSRGLGAYVIVRAKNLTMP
jgi:hypothetical protein